MGLKALLQLRISRLLDHLRQRFHDLLFGIVDVLQLVHEQVVHRLDVFREQSHRSDPRWFREHVTAPAWTKSRLFCRVRLLRGAPVRGAVVPKKPRARLRRNNACGRWIWDHLNIRARIDTSSSTDMLNARPM